MKTPFLAVLLPLLLWQCATPAVKIVAPKPAPLVQAAPPDDDHRSVSRDEFQASAWKPLPAVTAWTAVPGGVTLTLADGRELGLTFLSTSAFRWWVPAGLGDHPLSPSARYPASLDTVVKTKETDGVLSLDTPGLGLRLTLANLSWFVIQGDKTVLKTAGGPRAAGRRLMQAFAADSAVRWVGPGLSADTRSAKFWSDNTPNPDGTGPWAAPVLFGAGGSLPFVVSLDNSYQTYSRLTEGEASLGALNGGLDLLVAADVRASGTLEAMTSLTGRPKLPPLWAHGTALILPPGDTGSFVRKAGLSIQTAAGPVPKDRSKFQLLVAAPQPSGPLPDLTKAETRSVWMTNLEADSWPIGAGVALASIPGRQDWAARFDDQGLASPLARMNNRLAELEAKTVAEARQVRSPSLRPFVLAESGGLGAIRHASPEVRVVAGQDEGVLAQVLAAGVSGLGTPAIRLDLTALARPETKDAAFRSLASWLMAPVLILDFGADPAGLWSGLAQNDRQRLKTLLDHRSQFKPLFAQMARESAEVGLPAWRPLWFDSPKDPKALGRDDEFLLDGTLLAATVSGQAPSRPVYLPSPGVWFDFWSGEEFGGGKTYDIPVSADKPVLFVRGGGFVSVREAESFNDKDIYNPLTIHVFPGGRGTGTYWLDDGLTLAWQEGTYLETKVSYDYSQKGMELDQESVNLSPALQPDPYVLYRVHNVYKPQQVRIDGKPIPLYGDSWGITDSDRSAAWYENDHTLLIKTFHPEKAQTIQMSF